MSSKMALQTSILSLVFSEQIMQIAKLSALVATVLWISHPVFSAERTPTAFVGSFIDIAELDCESNETIDAETGETLEVICMDALYSATYRVEKVLEGDLVTGQQVTFTVADHYGFPKFAEQRRALIFLGEHQGSYYHVKYQWAPAFQTSDGQFAQCGCVMGTDEDGDTPVGAEVQCRYLSFSPPVVLDLTHASNYVIEKIRAGKDYTMQHDRAECARGILVQDIYQRLRPDLMDELNAR